MVLRCQVMWFGLKRYRFRAGFGCSAHLAQGLGGWTLCSVATAQDSTCSGAAPATPGGGLGRKLLSYVRHLSPSLTGFSELLEELIS